MGYVYCITNLVNGKRYIGITTKTIEQRWKEHCVNRRNSKSVFKNAIAKYGKESFIIGEIERCDAIADLFEREKFWIEHLNSFHANGRGYNMTMGGDGCLGYLYTKEQRQQMSESRKGESNGFFGKTHSNEIKQKLSYQRQGRKLTQEWKDAISRGQSGKINSSETRAKMSKSKSHLKKPIDQIDSSKNIRQFDSIKDAERWLCSNGYPSASKQYIRKAARTNSNAYGFFWRFSSTSPTISNSSKQQTS